MTILRVLLPNRFLAATAALLLSSAVLAAGTSALADAQVRYRQDLIDCNTGQTSQERSTCRQEARRTLSEARSADLSDQRWQEQQTALQRCRSLTGIERSDCEARLRPQAAVNNAVVIPERASVNAAARYRREMVACDKAPFAEDRAACRQDAKVGYAEALRGGLNDVPGQYRQNQLDRCNALSGSDRGDCAARMRGAGSVDGTVSGGGILRETITIVPAK